MDPALIIALVAPLVAIQVTLIVIALRDLSQPERRVQGGNKAAWVAIIVILGIIGPLAYFWFGREPE